MEPFKIHLACSDILLCSNCRRDAGCAGRGSSGIYQRPRPSDCRHDRQPSFFSVSALPSSEATLLLSQELLPLGKMGGYLLFVNLFVASSACLCLFELF